MALIQGPYRILCPSLIWPYYGRTWTFKVISPDKAGAINRGSFSSGCRCSKSHTICADDVLLEGFRAPSEGLQGRFLVDPGETDMIWLFPRRVSQRLLLLERSLEF